MLWKEDTDQFDREAGARRWVAHVEVPRPYVAPGDPNAAVTHRLVVMEESAPPEGQSPLVTWSAWIEDVQIMPATEEVEHWGEGEASSVAAGQAAAEAALMACPFSGIALETS